MSWQEGVIVTVVGGVLLAGALAPFRFIGFVLSRRQVPSALEQSVSRKSYLRAVLSESERDSVDALDVLAPRLMPASDNTLIARIQVSWKRISGHGEVRVLTLDSDECLKAGAELLRDGIQVRVARRELGAESLSYHLFKVRADRMSRDEISTAIINHHQRGNDQPMRLNGAAPVEVFRNHFEKAWELAIALESVVAERIIENAGGSAEVKTILRTLNEARARLNLDQETVERVLPHLAFRHGCPVVFVVGLPGAGKSYVRRILADQLKRRGVRVQGLSDYVYAYRDFLHGLIKLDKRGIGFQPYTGGAFMVQDEATLQPALQALAQAVRGSVQESEITLVEFARADLVAALEEFGELRTRSHVIHVEASPSLRESRLIRRAEPPESVIDADSVRLTLSDNHLLPSTVERSLYGEDDIKQLKKSPRWRDRTAEIENDIDDDGQRVNASVQAFIDRVVDRYRHPTPERDDSAQQAAQWV